MRSDIQRFCLSCDVCQKAKQARRKNKVVGTLIRPPRIASNIQMDAWGPAGDPAKRTKRGNRYVISIVEAFTRYCMMKPRPNDNAQTSAEVLMKWSIAHGFVRSIYSGMDAPLLARAVQYMNARMGIQHNSATAYSPSMVGGVERNHGHMQDRLRAICGVDQKDWDLYVPYAEYTCNTCPHKIHPHGKYVSSENTFP